jgi:hypothetical protein
VDFGPGCGAGAGVLARRAAGEAEAAVAIFGYHARREGTVAMWRMRGGGGAAGVQWLCTARHAARASLCGAAAAHRRRPVGWCSPRRTRDWPRWRMAAGVVTRHRQTIRIRVVGRWTWRHPFRFVLYVSASKHFWIHLCSLYGVSRS